MNKVIFIDEGFIKHRAIFAFKAQKEINTSAVGIFIAIIFACLKRVGVDFNDRVIIACDYGRSWRKSEDPLYKAQRKGVREEQESKEWWDEMYREFNEFYPQIEPVLNWNFVRLTTIEADDWCSVGSRVFSDSEVVIISSDTDLEQLAYYKNVKIFSPMSKKYKLVKNPVGILQKKIKGDIVDNLKTVPQTEAEYEIRKRIVNLLELPDRIEKPLSTILSDLPKKDLLINKIPFHSLQQKLIKLYNIK